MKMAIIGSGPVALYSAAHFEQLGAHVVLFQRSPLGGLPRFMRKYQIHGQVDYPHSKSIETFWEEDLVPLIEFVEEKKIAKKGDVLRVHKRFLDRREAVPGHGRLIDLFRVVYSVNPQDSILNEKALHPEMFEKLGKDVLDSLSEPIEHYEDFDVVIEATGRGKNDFKMGPGGAYALNEKNLNHHAHFYYGKDFFKKINLDDPTLKTLAIVGDDIASELAFFKLQDWLIKNEDHRVYWIRSSLSNQFHLKDELQPLFQFAEKVFDHKKEKFEEDVRLYRDRPDYEKAKISPPLPPQRKCEIFYGHNVTSIDRLLDRDGLFMTIETPEFRMADPVDKNLRTLAIDAVVIENGVNSEHSLGENLTIDEPGFYAIHTDSLKEAITQIYEIETNLMSFFSKSEQ